MKLRVPGDKSMTQRALILASLAEGRSRLAGLLYGGDAASTAGALRALGAGIGSLPADGGEVLVDGVGLRGLSQPTASLDLGNSGTGARLLLGVLAGSGRSATVTGDASLRTRPMARVTEPLSCMGAGFEWKAEPGRLPVLVDGRSPLSPIMWESPVASAQVKSALLLAGLTGGAFVLVSEPRRSRDHTERMLNAAGASVLGHAGERGWSVELRDPPERLSPIDFTVPGDPSSAAFLLTLAALGGSRSPITVEGVGLNPTRTGFLELLTRAGARVETENEGVALGEPWGRIRVEAGNLRAVEVDGSEVPALIDELPLVAVLGARAEGRTRITGAGELRVKESDRIRALVDNLRTLGVGVEELEDGLVVEGGEAPLRGTVSARGDHRIAMAFAVLGALPGNRIAIDERDVVDVSFPGFWSALRRAGGKA